MSLGSGLSQHGALRGGAPAWEILMSSCSWNHITCSIFYVILYFLPFGHETWHMIYHEFNANSAHNKPMATILPTKIFKKLAVFAGSLNHPVKPTGGETPQYRCDHLRWRSCESQGIAKSLNEINRRWWRMFFCCSWRFDEPMLDYVRLSNLLFLRDVQKQFELPLVSRESFDKTHE